jgi:hypothetical protein
VCLSLCVRCVWGALADVPSCGGTASRPARGPRGGVMYVPPLGAEPVATWGNTANAQLRRHRARRPGTTRTTGPRGRRRHEPAAAAKAQLITTLQSLTADFDPTNPQQRRSAGLALKAFTTVVRFLAPPAQSRRRTPTRTASRPCSPAERCTSHPSRSRAGRAVRTTRLTPGRRAQAPAAPDTSARHLTRGRPFAHTRGRHCRLAHDRVASGLAAQDDNRPWHGRPPS